MDTVGNDIADEQHVAELRRKVGRSAIRHSGNASAAVVDRCCLGRKAKPVVRLTKTLVITLAQEHRHGPRMAIGRIKVAERIETEAKRIDLSPTVLLNGRAISPEAISVARLHVKNFVAVTSYLDVAIIRVAMI